MRSLLNRVSDMEKWHSKVVKDEEKEFWDSVRYGERSRRRELNHG